MDQRGQLTLYPSSECRSCARSLRRSSVMPRPSSSSPRGGWASLRSEELEEEVWLLRSSMTVVSLSSQTGTIRTVLILPDLPAWSAPSSISPNNLTVGLMLGMDVYDAVLVVRTAEVSAFILPLLRPELTQPPSFSTCRPSSPSRVTQQLWVATSVSLPVHTAQAQRSRPA